MCHQGLMTAWPSRVVLILQEEFVAQIGTHGSLTVWSMSSVSAVFSTKIMVKDTSKEQDKASTVVMCAS